MKNIIPSALIVFLSLVLITFHPATVFASKANSKTEKEVKAALNKLWEYFSKKDIKGLMSLYSNDSSVTAIGSSAGEKFFGPEEIKSAYERDFTRFRKIKSFSFKVSSVSSSGNVAWLAAENFTTLVVNNQTLEAYGRMTAVLKKMGDRWLFMQTHFSIPIAGSAQ